VLDANFLAVDEALLMKIQQAMLYFLVMQAAIIWPRVISRLNCALQFTLFEKVYVQRVAMLFSWRKVTAFDICKKYSNLLDCTITFPDVHRVGQFATVFFCLCDPLTKLLA
jgi:hypothetical protein